MDIDQVLKKINKRTLGIFITHAQGFNGLTDKLLKAVNKNKLYLIEDVCESHGATYKNKKLGTFGLMSNLSYYYAHYFLIPSFGGWVFLFLIICLGLDDNIKKLNNSQNNIKSLSDVYSR